MKFEKTVAMLRSMEAVRTRLEAMEECLEQLSDEERMVIEMLCLHPEKRNMCEICDILNMERTSVYRLKNRILAKIQGLFEEKMLQHVRDDFSWKLW